MAEKIATREAYGSALAEFGNKYNIIVFDADLAEATKPIKFKNAHPDKFFDCGIAESNMLGVAAGAAAAGMIPFVSSFAMFAAGRALSRSATLLLIPSSTSRSVQHMQVSPSVKTARPTSVWKTLR